MRVKKGILKAGLSAGLVTLLLVQASLLSTQAVAGMFGFLKRYDVHLSPEVHGSVTLDGKPMANLEVYRELHYGKNYIDKTVTGSDGRFSLPEKNIRSRIPGRLIDETRLRQVVSVYYDNKPYLLWYAVTDRIKEEKVVMEKLSTLDCDLKTPETSQHFVRHENPSFTHDISSICRWESGHWQGEFEN